MISYYFFFALPLLGIFTSQYYKKNLNNLLWLLILTIYIFIIGFRYEVGGDWGTYTHGITQHTLKFNPLKFDIRSDYGYELLTWISYNLGFHIYGANFFSSIVFILSLSYFCSLQPNKWLAIFISFPILIIVLGMGFTRQGVAFSFFLLGIISLIKKNQFNFFIYLFLAVLFHKSIIIFTPLYFIIIEKFDLKKILIFSIYILLVLSFVYEDLNQLIRTYIISKDTNKQGGLPLVSYGVYYRLILNLIPALIMLIYRNKITKNITEKRIFIIFSLLVIIYFIFADSYSVVVDRMNLYTSIIQVYVLSRLCNLFDDKEVVKILNIFIVIYYFLIFFVWINFSVNAHAWLPYMNYFFHK